MIGRPPDKTVVKDLPLNRRLAHTHQPEHMNPSVVMDSVDQPSNVVLSVNEREPVAHFS
jgi:hypothetical protein